MVGLTESCGDGFTVGMHVLDGKDGEHQTRVIFWGPVDELLASGHFVRRFGERSGDDVLLVK